MCILPKLVTTSIKRLSKTYAEVRIKSLEKPVQKRVKLLKENTAVVGVQKPVHKPLYISQYM